MGAYVLRRVLLTIPLVVAVAALVWGLLQAMPGDYCDSFLDPELNGRPEAVAALRHALGCDLPLGEQFLAAMRSILTLDFGVSLSQRAPVRQVLAAALPRTLLLTGTGFVLGQLLAIPIGVFQAARQGRAADVGLSMVTLAFYSLPAFWLGVLLQLLLTLVWRLFPTSGVGNGGWDTAWHLVLPATTLALASAAADARYVRGAMLEVIRQDYIRTARAKGASEARVLLVHALRNALLPTVALFGLRLPYLFSGAVLVESIYAWPGLGRVLYAGISLPDLPLISGAFFLFAMLVAAGGLLADLATAAVDPRVRLDR